MDQVPLAAVRQPADGSRVPATLARRAGVHHRRSHRSIASAAAPARAALPLRPPADRRPSASVTSTEIAFPVLGRAPWWRRPRHAPTSSCPPGTPAIVYGQKLQPITRRRRRRRDRRRRRRPGVGRGDAHAHRHGRDARFHYAGFNDDTPGHRRRRRRPCRSGSPRSARSGGRFAPARSSASWATPTRCPLDENRGTGDRRRVAASPAHDLRPRRAPASTPTYSSQQPSIASACHVGIGPWSVPADERSTRPTSRAQRHRGGGDRQRRLDAPSPTARSRRTADRRWCSPPEGLPVGTGRGVRPRCFREPRPRRVGRPARRSRPSTG